MNKPRSEPSVCLTVGWYELDGVDVRPKPGAVGTITSQVMESIVNVWHRIIEKSGIRPVTRTKKANSSNNTLILLLDSTTSRTIDLGSLAYLTLSL